jgi:3'-phosphoadenosine 5'-phosphosulfate sulfotransferase (PAPS reductase)/FAD synthetase
MKAVPPEVYEAFAQVQPKVLSYGAGVQSRTMLQLMVEGYLPKPDLAIFCDLGAEPQGVYQAVAEDQAKAQAAGIEFRVVHSSIVEYLIAKPKEVMIPAYTMDFKGVKGMINRACTEKFKIRPINKVMRTELAATRKRPAGQLLGISTDEAHRAKPSRVLYTKSVYPLLEAGWSRQDCLDYLASRDISAAKSACSFCPYASPKRMRELIVEDPRAFAIAVEVDEMIRDRRLKNGVQCFVHASLRPLKEAIQLPPSDQDDLFGNECTGHCFL